MEVRYGSVTLDDVARAAGVSRATASRVLNGSERSVKPESQRRVTAAAMELGYIANAAAQATARGRSKGIVFMTNAMSDDYVSPIAAGVMHAAERSDLTVSMLSTGDRNERSVSILNALRGQRPQLIILAGSRYLNDSSFGTVTAELEAYEREGGRVVILSQAGLPFDTISIDNFGGGEAIAAALFDLGYRRFTVLAGPENARTSLDRLNGIRQGLRERGVELAPGQIIHSTFGRDGGYVAAGEFLRRRSPTDAIIATSDAVAIGALVRFREAGLRLPEDLALSGFDDITALRDISPALTTVRLPWDEVGELALKMGLGFPETTPREVTLEGYVVLRESTPVIAASTV